MKRKICVCPKCGRALNFSDNPEYTFQCLDCDEDFYAFEAKEIEQPRMEGVKDYTQLVEASMKAKEITESAIQENVKCIKIKGESILEQIAEYIHETLKPVFNSGIYKENRFRSSACIYNERLSLRFHDCVVDGKEYNARLMMEGSNFYYESDYIYAYFNENEYHINDIRINRLPFIVENWKGLKDSMHRMIPYAISRCNEENQRNLEKQKEMSEVIDSFRL